MQIPITVGLKEQQVPRPGSWGEPGVFGELPDRQAWSVGEGAPGLVKRFLLKCGEQGRQGREA